MTVHAEYGRVGGHGAGFAEWTDEAIVYILPEPGYGLVPIIDTVGTPKPMVYASSAGILLTLTEARALLVDLSLAIGDIE